MISAPNYICIQHVLCPNHFKNLWKITIRWNRKNVFLCVYRSDCIAACCQPTVLQDFWHSVWLMGRCTRSLAALLWIVLMKWTHWSTVVHFFLTAYIVRKGTLLRFMWRLSPDCLGFVPNQYVNFYLRIGVTVTSLYPLARTHPQALIHPAHYSSLLFAFKCILMSR